MAASSSSCQRRGGHPGLALQTQPRASGGPVDADFDTLATALYVTVDDLPKRAEARPVDRPGSSPGLILCRSSPASRPFVPRGADGSTLSRGSPRGTLRALVPRGLCGDGVPGDGPGGLKPKRVSSREDWSISTALCLRRIGRLLHDHFPRWEAIVLGVGIDDCAEEFHVVALGRPDEGVIEIARCSTARRRSPRWLPRSRDWSQTRQKSGS